MNPLVPLPPTFVATRDALQRVAVHIVARARSQGTGRFGLRVTIGGFGTPDFGEDVIRVRVSGVRLVRESAGVDGSASTSIVIDGASLDDLAGVAEVDLGAELDVGHDTPAIGDSGAPLSVDGASADALSGWFATVAAALDRVVDELPVGAAPTVAQLWPEHFDVALDAAASPDRRANLGGSPGDDAFSEPYAYVGPWTDDRPGDDAFWNASFGAVLGYRDLVGDDDPVDRLARFYLDGMRRLAT